MSGRDFQSDLWLTGAGSVERHLRLPWEPGFGGQRVVSTTLGRGAPFHRWAGVPGCEGPMGLESRPRATLTTTDRHDESEAHADSGGAAFATVAKTTVGKDAVTEDSEEREVAMAKWRALVQAVGEHCKLGREIACLQDVSKGTRYVYDAFQNKATNTLNKRSPPCCCS